MKRFLRILNKLNMKSQRGRWHLPMGSSENLWGTESSNTTLSTSTKSEPEHLSIYLMENIYSRSVSTYNWERTPSFLSIFNQKEYLCTLPLLDITREHIRDIFF